MNYIYSYRITYFGGTAPCFDQKLLSLAICKRDMRRVLGRRYLQSKGKDRFWILGICGAHLAEFTPNQICYIAKVTDVKRYSEYFTSKAYGKRPDRIYVPSKKGTFDDCNQKFKHYGKDIHSCQKLQARDWDRQHQKRGEHFVLLSECFKFVDAREAKQIEAAIKALQQDNLLAKGVGHKVFCADDYDKSQPLLHLMESVASNEDLGIENLPDRFQTPEISCLKGCGTDKGI